MNRMWASGYYCYLANTQNELAPKTAPKQRKAKQRDGEKMGLSDNIEALISTPEPSSELLLLHKQIKFSFDLNKFKLGYYHPQLKVS